MQQLSFTTSSSSRPASLVRVGLAPLRKHAGGTGRRALCAASPINGTSVEKNEEKFISVADMLKEAREMGGDKLVFEDNEEGDVWDFESRIRREAYKHEELAEMEDFEMDKQPHLQQQESEPVVTAYDSEQGFQEMTVSELHRALSKQQQEQQVLQQGSGEAEPAAAASSSASTSGGCCGGGCGGSSAAPVLAAVLDVRSREEYEGGHVPGAMLVPLDELSEAVRAGQLDSLKSSTFAVICGSGMRSAQACVRLSKVFGFTSPINVQGGTQAWVREGLELQAGPQPGPP